MTAEYGRCDVSQQASEGGGSPVSATVQLPVPAGWACLRVGLTSGAAAGGRAMSGLNLGDYGSSSDSEEDAAGGAAAAAQPGSDDSSDSDEGGSDESDSDLDEEELARRRKRRRTKAAAAPVGGRPAQPAAGLGSVDSLFATTDTAILGASSVSAFVAPSLDVAADTAARDDAAAKARVAKADVAAGVAAESAAAAAAAKPAYPNAKNLR